MVLLRLVAVFLFLFALIGEARWGVNWSERTINELVIGGWLCLAASFLPIPSPPG